MEPEPEIDLHALDPSRDPEAWDRRIANVASRALAGHRRRERALRRGALALVVSVACALAVWWSAPRRERPHVDLLDWATSEVSAADVLGLETNHAR
jgi:hypothetical protein